MQQAVTTFGSEKNSMITMLGRKDAVKSLKKWFLDGRQAPLVEFAWGSRDVQLVDGRYAVKVLQQPFALHEYAVTLRAESLSEITPRVGGLLLFENLGSLATEYLNGVPLIVLSQQGLGEEDARRIRNGAFHAIGCVHRGNGRHILLHNDLYGGNFLVMFGKDGVLLGTSDRADVRLIDLEHSAIVKSGKDALAPMMKDILFAMESLKEIGILSPEDIAECLEHYLDASQAIGMAKYLLDHSNVNIQSIVCSSC